MNTYWTTEEHNQRKHRAMSVPAGTALVIFLLAAAAAIWLLLTSPPPSQRVVALGPSKAVAVLELTLSDAESEPTVEPTAAPPARKSELPVPLAEPEAPVRVEVAPERAPPVEEAAPDGIAPVNESAPAEEKRAIAEPVVAEVPAKGTTEAAPPADRPAEADEAEAALPEEPAAEEAPVAIAALAPDERMAVPPPEPVASAVPEAVPTEPEAPLAPAGERDTTGGGLTWLAYARPFDGPRDWPQIAVVVSGLGLGRAATTAAIRLPGGITLAFSSYARDLQQWIDLARAAGHEVMLDVPMEPVGYPNVDPGPEALLTTLSSAENIERLEWHLDRASGYVGVTHNMGSRFTASADDLRPVLSALKARGVMYLDSRTSSNSVAARLATMIGLPRAINDRFLDAKASRSAIDRRLREIERIAREKGYAVAVSQAFPVTLERLGRWAATLDDKKLALAPISALVNKQAVR